MCRHSQDESEMAPRRQQQQQQRQQQNGALYVLGNTVQSVNNTIKAWNDRRRGMLTEREISTLLRNLRRSSTLEEAMESMRELYAPLNTETDQFFRQNAAQKIGKLDGVGTTLMALTKWHEQSMEFCYLAFQLLIRITFFVPRTKRFIINSGGMKTIVAAVKAHDGDYLFKSSVAGLLCNLALGVDEDTKAEIAGEECIDFVLNAMEVWPDKEYVQKRGCIYLYEISQIENVRNLLHKKRSGLLCIDALDRYRDTNPDVHKWAEKALVMYART